VKYFIFRNFTVEPFFRGIHAVFSGYTDISRIDNESDIYVWFYLPPYKPDNAMAAREIERYAGLLGLALAKIGKDKPVIVLMMSVLYRIDYSTTDTVLAEAISNYNRTIYRLAQEESRVKIINIIDFYREFSCEQIIDWKYYFISEMPLNPKLANDFCGWFLRRMEAIEMKRKKCLVVDLDNTLWGGILGEDGIEGIKLSGDYPGNAFRFFQEFLLELKKTGVMLAICSKNNEVDVLEVFDKHPDMQLKKSDFVTMRINWNNKAENIKEMAEELNIGLDSIVFIDDNPAEREFIKQTLPTVTVADFPLQPYLYPEFAKKLTDKYFSLYTLTDEDKVKTRQYQENAARTQYRNQFADMESYLRSLEMVLTVEKMTGITITRMAQMTQKTNQFNLTSCRYTEADIRLLAEKGAWVYGLRVKDKFGDHGLSGLIIIEFKQENAIITTLLLSCRILGKNIERAFLVYILMKLKKTNHRLVTSEYIETSKNRQVENFYETIGFDIKHSASGYKKYEINLEKAELTISDIYKIEEICGNK